MLCLCAAQLKFWFRRWKFSQPLRAGKTDTFHFSHHSHTLITLYVQFLCSDWSKFDRWVHVENLCIILKLVSFDSWSWPSFVSTCDVCNCLFPLDAQNEIQLLSRVFCYSWLVGFWLRNWYITCESRKSDFGWHRFRFSPCLMRKGWKVWSDTGLTWYLSGAACRMISLSNYCVWCLFFISNLMKSSVVYAAI